MKKIPCLFVRDFIPRANGRGQEAVLTRDVTPGLEWVLAGDGVPTRKWDGTACMVREGRLFKRYDAKNGKPAPATGIPCDNAADPVTGHWPHWVPVGEEPESKWHRAAWERVEGKLDDGTYELCGPHFAPHEHHHMVDEFFRHGAEVLRGVDAEGYGRSFDGLRKYLELVNIEGIVFWLDGEPRCKIRRADFGLPWGGKR